MDVSDKTLLGLSLPGNNKLDEMTRFSKLLGEIKTEASKLEGKFGADKKVLPKLVGYDSAMKIVKNHLLTLIQERSNTDNHEIKATQEIIRATKQLDRAEKEVPLLANKLMKLIAEIQKSQDNGERAKLKEEAKKLVDGARKTVLAANTQTWELRRKAAPEHFALN